MRTNSETLRIISLTQRIDLRISFILASRGTTVKYFLVATSDAVTTPEMHHDLPRPSGSFGALIMVAKFNATSKLQA